MYAWIITHDHLVDVGENGDVGTIGPANATEADKVRLRAGEGDVFNMRDDDGELYYSGRLVVSGNTTHDDQVACFGPLDDFGMPNAGCTTIRWPGHPERNNG